MNDEATLPPADEGRLQRPVRRLREKLAARDRQIAAMKKHIAALESELARRQLQKDQLPIDVQRAVQRALCNVRMIPVLGLHSDERILEVRVGEKPSNTGDEGAARQCRRAATTPMHL